MILRMFAIIGEGWPPNFAIIARMAVRRYFNTVPNATDSCPILACVSTETSHVFANCLFERVECVPSCSPLDERAVVGSLTARTTIAAGGLGTVVVLAKLLYTICDCTLCTPGKMPITIGICA